MKQVIQRSDNNAVSPIIATIILIAITIVLAATLYTALTYYASTASSSKPPVAVSISATLTEKCYVNQTECHSMPYGGPGFSNNTTFYELYINSINGCNGNISLKDIQFIISYRNNSISGRCVWSCFKYLIQSNGSLNCTVISSIQTKSIIGSNFTLTWFHPIEHMISGSIFLFQPYYFNYAHKMIYSPQNKIYSIEAVNYVNQTVLFTANIS
jgi:flagellin-like protein